MLPSLYLLYYIEIIHLIKEAGMDGAPGSSVDDDTWQNGSMAHASKLLRVRA